jgi:hypothetical protein
MLMIFHVLLSFQESHSAHAFWSTAFFGLPNFGLVFYHGANYVLGIAQAEMAIMRNWLYQQDVNMHVLHIVKSFNYCGSGHVF